ncbi:acyl-CoA dehydrogenase [Microbacterium schleiferi]|uniref:acyl-CoA dehydrogenase n=1 Tax=Microbacterium schleiferi TaxID=69362 RepID=UPI001E59CC72|nr:acyl-CoA dehydrogenase [Microbacterium schleiferi]
MSLRPDPAAASVSVRGAVSAAAEIDGFGTDVDPTLAWCVAVGEWAPPVGEGRTTELWELLASTAAVDVAAARILEPHLDALTILAQAERSELRSPHDTWGVFAAESPDHRLRAEQSRTGWRLRGTKPWCSLASHLSRALVTATLDDGRRRLFAVDLRADGVRPHAGPWAARGLAQVVSAPVDFDDAPGEPVGEAGWYLERPGFAWGGMSVAACWWGAATRIAQRLLAPAQSANADQLSLVHLGKVDTALWSARAVLAEAADLVDDGRSRRVGERAVSERLRAVVADAATLTLAEAAAALGPGPLTRDEQFARNSADLHLYLQQHHGLRDVARIGREAARQGAAW